MARQSDFTKQEWETMQKGVHGAGLLVSVSDRGLLGSLKEARALAQHVRAGRNSASQLVSELSKTFPARITRPSTEEELERETLDALRASVAVLEAKAPDEVDAYRQFVAEVAESVAGAAKDAGRLERVALDALGSAEAGEQSERAVIGRIRAALGVDGGI